MEGIGIDFEAPCLNESVVDEFIPVADKQGLGMLQVIASQYGFLIGPSSGAVACAVDDYAKKFTKNDIVVMVFADSGRAYLSKDYFGR